MAGGWGGREGAILVVGPSERGNTTTAYAAGLRVHTRAGNAATVEAPIEYRLPDVNQIEVSEKSKFTFAEGLRSALHQNPEVILVGEMRDKETIEIALSAAETGHLVMSTLHTNDAGATVNRVLGFFEREEEKQIRIRLSDAIRWIACQRLLPKIVGGRVAAFEILGKNLRVTDAILHGESAGKTFYDMLEQGQPFGMMTFDECIADLYRQGLITEETAMSYASRKVIVGRAIDMVKSERGERTTAIDGLKMDSDYGKGFEDGRSF